MMYDEDDDIQDDAIKQYEIDIIDVMKTRGGRNVMFQQLMLSRVFSNVFDIDSRKHAHYAGMQAVGIETLRTLKSVCYDSYLQMMKENEDG